MAATRSKEAVESLSIFAVAGSYEGGLYGWRSDVLAGDQELETWQLKTPKVTWAFGAHIGAIKAVAIDDAGEILATGGDDEYIRLFNLSALKERGELTQHTGSVTALSFYRSSHLLSASQDGTVCIWRASDWLCLHVLGGHKVRT
jgi:protein MAK11